MAELILGPVIDKAVERLVGPVIDQIKFDDKRELNNEIRSLILVVVTLIAVVAFQAGINPPGGLWQDNQNGVNGHVAGSAIFAYRKQAAYYVFLVFNTLAFTTSTFIIFAFTQGFLFGFEIRLAIVSIIVTYACAVSAFTPPESANLAYVLLVALLPIVIRILPIVIRPLIRLCCRKEEREPENDSRNVTTAQALFEGNSHPPLSEAEVWNMLEALKLDSNQIISAYVYLLEHPDKLKAVLGCPLGRRLDIVMRVVFNAS